MQRGKRMPENFLDKSMCNNEHGYVLKCKVQLEGQTNKGEVLSFQM